MDKDVIFADGALDSFTGTQEELDALTLKITEQINDLDFEDTEGKIFVMVLDENGNLELKDELNADFKLDKARILN